MQKEHPILFSTPMVQAILALLKTIIRRLKGFEKINENPDRWEFVRFYNGCAKFCEKHNWTNEIYITCPYGQPDDILWVREIWRLRNETIGSKYFYAADDNGCLDLSGTWKPSIHMPKAACRLFLKITDIRVERLQDISEEDAIDEGIESFGVGYKVYIVKGGSTDSAIGSFSTLWEKINGIESCKSNPWVWVIQFEQIKK